MSLPARCIAANQMLAKGKNVGISIQNENLLSGIPRVNGGFLVNVLVMEKKIMKKLRVSYMKKSGFGVLMVVLLMVCFAFSVHAQTAFKIGSPSFPPYVYALDDGEITGLATEIVAGIFQSMEIDYETRIYPWARVLNMLTEGEIHALYTIMKNTEREAIFYYPEEPITHSKWVFFIRRTDAGKLKFDSFDDLKGKRIGLIRDTKYTPALWEFVEKEQNYELVAQEPQNFEKLVNNRIDYLVTEYTVGMSVAKTLGIENDIVALTDNPLESTPLYIAFSQKMVKKEFVDRFSNELKNFKAGRYEKILKKYIEK